MPVKKNLFYFIIIVVFVPNFAQANSYREESIGYLYEKCQSAIKVKSAKEFYQSWCGIFTVGYMHGVTNALWKNHHKHDTNTYNDKCIKEIQKEKEYEKQLRCGGRGPIGLLTGATPLDMIQYFFAWVEWLKVNNPQKLENSIVPYVNSISYRGSFCETLSNKPFSLNNYDPNSNLILEIENITDLEIEDNRDDLTPDFESCVKQVFLNKSDYYNNLCSAYYSGMMSGIFITDFTIDRDIESVECTSDIEKFHKYEILSKDSCFPTDPYKLHNLYAEIPAEHRDNVDLCEVTE